VCELSSLSPFYVLTSTSFLGGSRVYGRSSALLYFQLYVHVIYTCSSIVYVVLSIVLLLSSNFLDSQPLSTKSNYT
jgi:hypothetical protein